jgi:hypothetical protein
LGMVVWRLQRLKSISFVESELWRTTHDVALVAKPQRQ